MVIHTVLILGLCARWVNALAFAAPTVTQYGDYAYNGWTPALTKAPEHQLLQRQEVIEGLDSTIWRAKSYLFGSYYDYYYTTGTRATYFPYGCSAYSETAFFQKALISTRLGRMGCCGDGYCDAPIDCINSRDFSTACKGRPCETDTLTRKCTALTAPYCVNIYLYGISVRGNDCVEQSTSAITVYTSRLDQTVAAVTYIRVIITQTTSSGTSSSTTSSSISSQSTTRSSSTSSSSTTSAPSSSTTIIPLKSDPVPIGPIVGGAVGGFAVLALIGFALFFLISRHRKEKQLNAQQMDYTVVHQQQQPPLSPPIYLTGGDKHSSMHSQSGFGSTSPLSGATGSGAAGRESFMSGPGFDGAGMVPYERQELETTPGKEVKKEAVGIVV